jgi:hypothetical protein
VEEATVLGRTKPIESYRACFCATAGALPFFETSARPLKRALELTQGKIYGGDGAAALLKLKPTTLQAKLKKHRLR